MDDRKEKILSDCRKRLKLGIEAFDKTRQSELQDLKFFAGSPDNNLQWPAEVVNSRTTTTGGVNARPCLTINKLPQHVRQVTNDQRQNRPSGKVIPADDKSDVEVAEIYNGVIRHIEYISDADVAYDTACENQVVMGEGYIRIITEYCDSNTFDQDIKIVRVKNPFTVYLDPSPQDPCGQGAKWGIITEDILKVDYETQWPDAKGHARLLDTSVGNSDRDGWITEDTVRIAEYFYTETETKTLNLYPGNVSAFSGSPEDKTYSKIYGKPKKTRQSNIDKIKWVKTNGFEILEETEWLGKNIPIIRVVGNEFEFDGEIHFSGLVRNAKDAQRMYNYWVSQEAEMLALAPKAPFIGYGGQFEGYEEKWRTANTIPHPYLEVNPDVTDGNGGVLPLPQRALPPMAQTGLIQAKMGASEDIKATTGQYDASLGQVSNERSGKAIMARQKEGDTGTFHYVDNLARAVRYVTRQLVDLIPKIYDTERIARIIGEDGETSIIKTNPEQEVPVKKIEDQNGVVIEKIYNLGIGKYDVVVITGPGYATKRMEALEAMGQLLQGNPDLWKVAGDLFVKNMDWPGAQEMAKRFAKTIDPALMENQDDSPQMQAAKKQIEQMAQEMEQMHQMLKNVQTSLDSREVAVKEFDAETKRLSVVQANMTPEQIQDIVMGTLQSMAQTGDLGQMINPVPQMPMTEELSQPIAPMQE